MRRATGVLLAAACLLAAGSAGAQTPQAGLTLGLSRDFGYSWRGEIQGVFTLSAAGPDDLSEVRYLIDDQVVGAATEPPFRYRFDTGAYPLGSHTLAAVGVTRSGVELRSEARRVEFVSPEAGWQAAGRLALPILGGVALLMLLGTLGPLLLGRHRPFRPGVYGAEGGAVCPRCGLPFARHLLSPNLLGGKLERCPHCGRWSLARRATPSALAASEARLATENDRGAMQVPDEAARMRQMVDESRFEDG